MDHEIQNHQATRREIKKFLQSSRSAFVYIRGRRRVGKTTVLKQMQAQNSQSVFYFTGVLDERDQKTLERFSKNWSQFDRSSQLNTKKVELLSWELSFDEITNYVKKNKRPVTVIFDEIQWLAKGQNGFIGLLKNVWLEWEKSGLIKVIVCGSSNKFFHQRTGGEEQILRGLRTHSDIWLYDTSPYLLHEHYAPNWNLDQLLLTYFLIGGIPYYWNQISDHSNYFQAINSSIFSSSAIFLDEVNELLRVEFNSAGVETIKKIIRAIGVHGSNESRISIKSRLPQSTVNESIEKLIDYKLIFEKQNPFKIKGKKSKGTEYYIKDFLLNNYSQILYPNRGLISKNENNELIFTNILEGKKNLYIPDYTGVIFERFIQLLLEYPRVESQLHQVMKIDNISFDVSNFKTVESEIDLFLHNTSDEVYRVIECKWSQNPKLIKEEIFKIPNKILKIRENYNVKETMLSYLITNCKVNSSLMQEAKSANVTLIPINEIIPKK